MYYNEAERERQRKLRKNKADQRQVCRKGNHFLDKLSTQIPQYCFLSVFFFSFVVDLFLFNWTLPFLHIYIHCYTVHVYLSSLPIKASNITQNSGKGSAMIPQTSLFQKYTKPGNDKGVQESNIFHQLHSALFYTLYAMLLCATQNPSCHSM